MSINDEVIHPRKISATRKISAISVIDYIRSRRKLISDDVAKTGIKDPYAKGALAAYDDVLEHVMYWEPVS